MTTCTCNLASEVNTLYAFCYKFGVVSTKLTHADITLPRFIQIVKLSCLTTEFYNCLVGSCHSSPPLLSHRSDHI